jgi:drug/metabolite transporter (DMT)-like permease
MARLRSTRSTIQPSSRQPAGLAALFAGAAAIGFAPIFVRLSEVGPVVTGFYRIALALPVLAVMSASEYRGRETAARTSKSAADREWTGLAVAGFFFAGDLALWHWSLRFTSVANATMLPNVAPVFVTLFAFLLFGERVSARFLLGMVLAIAGAALLMGESVQLSRAHLLGDALALATAVFYAGYILAVSRLRQRVGTAALMLRSGAVSAGLLLMLAAATGETLWPPSWQAWMVLVGLAIISHAGGQSLIAYALAHLPAAFSSVGLLLQPAVAALLAWILFGEAIGPWQAAGMAVILAGIAVARAGSEPAAADGER